MIYRQGCSQFSKVEIVGFETVFGNDWLDWPAFVRLIHYPFYRPKSGPEMISTLDWAKSLGIPVDDIPPLWSEIGEFIASAELRDPDIVFAEEFRSYEVTCDA